MLKSWFIKYIYGDPMAAIDAEEKICTQCNLLLSTKEFYKFFQKGKKDQRWYYYDNLCKKCRCNYGHDRRKNLKIQAVNYLGNSCVDCNNVYDFCVYDFHHIDPSQKDFAISDNAKSFAKIKPELDKCVLLCANCHRIRHYK